MNDYTPIKHRHDMYIHTLARDFQNTAIEHANSKPKTHRAAISDMRRPMYIYSSVYRVIQS